jgi:AcrR family transcriptional regulator
MVKAPAKSPTQTQASATNTKKKVKVKKKASRLADARARMYYDLIFEASEAVFGRKGYEGATMQEIADEAGVSLKTLYATYESKQNLYAQIRRDRVGAFVAAMREAIERVDDPRDQIRALVETYPAFLLEREDWLRIHLRTWPAWAMRPADQELAISWQESRDDLTRVLSEGMARGVFYEGDPEEMSVVIQTVMQIHMTRAVGRGEQDPRVLADAMMVHVDRLLCPPSQRK